ncbi:MAG: O-antigen ligase family protein [Candidatus Hydrogenedentes bacterium]|nr:O-antigen ligase family protein [Candidatus Hydrogenedentota bacterium]MBI3118472.1 O-antigen ligase family protein [Candidatus Hydrogenedentota bacterium]
MIPFEAALIAWIPISFLLMADRDSARGFTLAYLLAILLLPAGQKIEFSGIPDLNKENVTGFGVLLGTIVFHPQLFDRYRFSIADLLIGATMVMFFLTSLTNGFGAYDGVSQALEFFISFGLPVFLARIHIGTLQSLRTFLLALVIAGVACAPFALWEWRMSPQLHQYVYGYFQHVFAQHMRGGAYRPILFFSHGLALGRFFALATFLALMPMRRDLIAYLGKLGNFVFLAPLAGLLLSQSWGPVMLFVLLCAGYWTIRRRYAFAYVVPVAAFAWAFSVMAGFNPGYSIVNQISAVNADRAESLGYRLDAWQEYQSIIANRPLFGHGGWGHGRISGRATDSEVLIYMLQRGFMGTFTYYAWWFCALHMAIWSFRRTKGTIFGQRGAALAVAISLCIAITVVDAALDFHILLAASGIIPIYQWLQRRPRIESLPKIVPHPIGLQA